MSQRSSLDDKKIIFRAYKPRKVDKGKYIKSKLEFGRWTQEERIKFMEAFKKFGKNWTKIRDFVGTRSDRQIRSHA